MRVLVACEFSGTVRDAFIAKGHEAVSCDLLPCDNDGPHYQGDIMDIIGQNWDLMIAHPPCTYMANSGVSWLHKDPQRWIKLFEAADFFRSLWHAGHIPKICIENPIMHKYAKRLVGWQQTQVVQPYMFGHMESKATCLWLKGLEPLQPTDNVKEATMRLSNAQRQRLHWLPESKDRWKLRSKTFQGLADAMAAQWS